MVERERPIDRESASERKSERERAGERERERAREREREREIKPSEQAPTRKTLTWSQRRSTLKPPPSLALAEKKRMKRPAAQPLH